MVGCSRVPYGAFAGSLRACAFVVRRPMYKLSFFSYSLYLDASVWTARFFSLATGRASGCGETRDGVRGCCDIGADALKEHPRGGAEVLAAGIAAWTRTSCTNSPCCVFHKKCVCVFSPQRPCICKSSAYSAVAAAAAAATCPTQNASREKLYYIYSAALLLCCGRVSVPLEYSLQRVESIYTQQQHF